MDLFERYEENDKWHAYRVCKTLKEAGHTRSELLAAALLHDVGKTRVALSAWDRTLIVVVEALLPKHADVWGQGEALGWRRPFVVRSQHPRWGAEMAKAADSAPLTVNLIDRHQDTLQGQLTTVEEEMLRQLQWADDQN